MLIDIDKIVVGERIRKDFGDIQELADDIKENTLLNALVVTPNGEGTYLLIAGERRLRACKSLGYKAVTVNVVAAEDAEQALRMEISENECRKDFSMTERLAYAEKLQTIKAAEAKQRMVAAHTVGTPNSAELGETRDVVAKAIGMGHETFRQARIIADNADLLDPAEFADWDEGRLSTNKAYQRIKAAQQQAERARKIAEMERDNANDALAEAYRTSELMEAQIASLQKQVNDKPKPEDVERIVEVPSESDKRRIAELEHERDLYLDNVQKLRKRNEDMRSELDKAKDMLGMDKTLQDVRKDVQYLTSATNQYVRQYGGLTWTAASLERVDAQSLAELRTAAINLATFANALVASLESFND